MLMNLVIDLLCLQFEKSLKTHHHILSMLRKGYLYCKNHLGLTGHIYLIPTYTEHILNLLSLQVIVF